MSSLNTTNKTEQRCTLHLYFSIRHTIPNSVSRYGLYQYVYRILPVQHPPAAFGTLDESLHTEGQHVSCSGNASDTYWDGIRLQLHVFSLPHIYWLFSVRSVADWISVNAAHHKSRFASNSQCGWTASLNIARYISVNNPVYPCWPFHLVHVI